MYPCVEKSWDQICQHVLLHVGGKVLVPVNLHDPKNPR